MQHENSKHRQADKADANRRAKAFRQHVQSAVSARAKGAQSPQYEKLVSELKAQRRRLEASQDDPAAEFHFIAIVEALTSCAATLKDGSHDQLLTAALGLPFWQCNKAVRQAVLDLAVELIVVSSAFVPNCLQVMIYNLLPPPGSSILPSDERGEAWTVPEEAIQVQAQIVDAMEKAVQLVPALPTRLLPMLIQSLPHKLRDRNAQCLYFRALVLLSEGKVGPPLRDGLLQGIVEHLLNIDADIKWEEIVDAPTGCDHEEGSSEEEDDLVFEIEGMSE